MPCMPMAAALPLQSTRVPHLTLNFSISAQRGSSWGWCLSLVLAGSTVGSCSKMHTHPLPLSSSPALPRDPQVRLFPIPHKTGDKQM